MKTAHDIINRSIIIHPSLFVEALESARKMHHDYSTTTPNIRAAQSATAAKKHCEAVLIFIKDEPKTAADIICTSCGMMVTALIVAAKLQGIPPRVRTAAAVDWQKANSEDD